MPSFYKRQKNSSGVPKNEKNVAASSENPSYFNTSKNTKSNSEVESVDKAKPHKPDRNYQTNP